MAGKIEHLIIPQKVFFSKKKGIPKNKTDRAPRVSSSSPFHGNAQPSQMEFQPSRIRSYKAKEDRSATTSKQHIYQKETKAKQR
jgi:hypothetical protein